MNEGLKVLFSTGFCGQNASYQDNGETNSQMVT